MSSPLQESTIAENTIFDSLHNKEVLIENYKYDASKTMVSLVIIGCILFAGDLFALAMANAISVYSLVGAVITPALFVGLGFLARVKPMLSMVLATILFVLLMVLTIYISGAKSIVSGWFVKAVLIYFFIKGFNHAKDAEEAKKNLAIINF